MKKSRNLISIVLSMGIFITASLLFCPEGEPAVSEPGREPGMEEISGEVKEAYSDVERAKEDWEKAKEERGKEADEAIKKERKYEEARLKLSTTLIAEADRQDKDTVFNPETKKEETVQDIKNDKKAIQEKIKQLSDQLGEQVYEPPVVEPVSQKVQDFQEEMNREYKRVREGAPVSDFAELLFDNASKLKENGLPDYESQKQALNALRDFLNKNVTREELGRLSTEERNGSERSDYFNSRKAMKDRVAEIDAFQKNPPRKIPNNKLAEKLALYKQIPSDQVKALKSENIYITNQLDELHKKLQDPAISKQEVQQLKDEVLRSLNEAIMAISVYGLGAKAPELSKWIDEQIKLFPVEEKPVPTATQNALELFGLDPDEIDKALQNEASLSEVLEQPIEIIQKGLKYALRKSGEDIVGLSPKVKKIGDIMKRSPKIIDIIMKVLPTVNDGISIAAKGSAYVPIDKAQKTGKELKKAEQDISNIIKSKEKIEKAGGFLGWLGPKFKDVSERIKMFGEWLKEKGAITPKQQPLTQEIIEYQNAEQLVQTLREEIFVKQEQRSRFAKIFEPIKNLAQKIGSWFKEKYTQLTKPNLTEAMANYSNARSEFLKAIGFSKEEIAQKPIADAIKSKLSKTLKDADASKKTEIDNARKNLAKRGKELASTFNNFVADLETSGANYAFIVNGWDVADSLNKPDIKSKVVDIVNQVDQNRAMQETYLQIAKEGAQGFRQDIIDVAEGTGFEGISNDFVDALERMINEKRIENLVDTDQNLALLDSLLKKKRKELEAILQEQAPSPPG